MNEKEKKKLREDKKWQGMQQASLPSLSELSLNTANTSGLLVWRVSSSSIGLSYFEAIEREIESISDSEFSELNRGEKRSRLKEEHETHLAWLRSCHVPSALSVERTGKLTGRIREINTNEERFFVAAINTANAALENMEKKNNVTVPRIEPDAMRKIVTRMNVANGAELQPPYFQTLNTDGRLAFHTAYIKTMTEMQATDGFTDLDLPDDSKLTNVAHIVPKAWLRTCNALAEFDGADNNPCNVITTRAEFNRAMGTKAIYLGKILGVESKYWAPAGFTLQSQAAVARAVACIALTYPFLSSTEEAIVGGTKRTSGLPLFYNQRQDIVRLLAVTPSEDHYNTAMLEFAVFGWANPLTLASEIRQMATDRNSQLHALLMARLGGTDLGSTFAAEAMRKENIEFNMPFFDDVPGTGTVESIRNKDSRASKRPR